MTCEHPVTEQRKFTTPGGRAIPFSALGFGSAPLGNYRRPLSEEECDKTLAAAWECGMRYFDTAPLYGLGLSEERVGRNLRPRKRSDYILSTKVGRLLEPCDPGEVNSGLFIDVPPMRFFYDYSYDGVMRSYEESRKRMGLDSADILYVHDIDAFSHGGKEGWEARMRELVDQGGWHALSELRENGEVAALGLGVNQWEPCARMLELIDPDLFLLAGRYTLLEQEPIDTLFPQCAERGVGIVIGGPYNSGVLAGRSTFNYAEIPADVADKVKRLKGVCEAHDTSLPQAALHFVLAHPLVVSVIPGGQTQQETEHNVELLHTKPPAPLWEELKERGLIHPGAPTPA